MNAKSNIGARLDRLPTSKWHFQVFWLIGLGLLIDGCDNYLGGVVTAQLVNIGWSNNYLNALFNSVTMAGLFVGSLFAGFSGDYLGRKVAYQINLLIFGIASIAAAFANDMFTLIVLRGIIGIGLGAEIVVGFATFSEFTPARSRGKWSSTLSLVGNCAPPITLGAAYLIMSAMGPEVGWRVMFAIIGAAALIIWVLRHGMPESPRWHESRGEIEKADEILSKVEKDIEIEKGIKLAPIEEQVMDEPQEIKRIPFSRLFQGGLLRTTIVAISVLIGMNTAIYSIVNWIPTIFVNAGISITKTLGMTTLMMFGAPLGVFLTTRFIDRFPRKWTAVMLLIVLGLLGFIYSLQRDETLIVAFGFCLTVVLYMYVCFASAVYVPELWPTEIRLRGSGFCNSIGRLVTVFTPYGVAWILTNYGSVVVFATIGGVMALVAVIVGTVGIETRQKSLEEIGRNTGV
ncbi:MAG: ral substrate transporter [Firmicutes bacterium]|nr:ral substrate transporter [Bacillota bacterium]